MNDTYDFGTTPKASLKKVRDAIHHANMTPGFSSLGRFDIESDDCGMRVIFWPISGHGSAFGVVSNATARECTGLVERIYGAKFLAVSIHRV